MCFPTMCLFVCFIRCLVYERNINTLTFISAPLCIDSAMFGKMCSVFGPS